MDKSVVADFKIPFKEDEEFWFKFDSKNWSFTRFFSIFSNNEEQKKYQTSADIHLDVRSQRGGFWTSTGDLIIEKVKLKKNNISMFNPEPMKIKIKNGKINSSNFKLVGNNSYIEFIADGLTKNNLNSHLKGQMKMTLLNILTPLQDLGGDLNFNLNFSGSVDNP
ncbi:MAG: hypothetical protein KDD50_01960, partial [Bdellovibrionales bacterium]|nr:hypothetical protein [Bdellovibrionales bacterium]